jgi:peptide/nickel transport system ATP-binding protein
MSLLSVRGLGVRYGDTLAVDDLSFSVEAGEAVGLVGESGSGKSQTALAILGLLPASAETSGTVALDGNDLLGACEKTLNRVRARRVAMVFQDPMQALNPYIRVGRQLDHVLRCHGIATGDAARQRAVDMLGRVGLPDPEHQYRAFPHELSGGMRQRVMIASALIAEPQLLIADEPTTALDVTVQAQILELLESLRRDTALLLITHDLGVVAGHCERVLVLQDGRLVDSGPTRTVFAAPSHAHTRALLDAAPRLDARADIAAASTREVLRVDDAAVAYARHGRAAVAAVRGVNLSLAAGETVAIVGESGSGKSSLVRAVLGLVPMGRGRVTFCGAAVAGPAQERTKALRKDLQLVFQDPVGSLNPRMRVWRIVEEPVAIHEPAMPGPERRARAAAALHQVGLGDEFHERYAHELSGGQAQRVAIARALIMRPTVLVCDEAVAALDGTVREQILKLLQAVQRETGLSILFISHDLAVVRAISHRVLVMYLGRLVEHAGNEQLFMRPAHPYTRALLDAVPVPDPDAPGGRATVRGESPSALQPPAGCAFHPRCRYADDRCRSEAPPPQRLGGTTVACHHASAIAERQALA